ncbi:hypothetical protein QBC38DRAFT_514824 [Podospora fimiseda]|uniref:Uncharacterized protein n=1 Tax=Podospora fimiseda TaxID=252190 RepID=A0AAN7BJS1_9PEZI|nr:hypothetical protein QBC38DRAFT_514824 [Podospora fimiseda]
MALVVMILAKIDGLAFESWLLPIQPNSLIAVLTTAAKTSMLVAGATCISQLKWNYFGSGHHRLYDIQLFDNASRGPWGSLMLLGNIRSSSMVLAYLLSLAAIAGLGIEPSTQQILEYLDTRGLSLRPYLTSVALFNGVLGSVPNPAFNCPVKASCSWPKFSTFGVCSRFENVTESVKSNCSAFDQNEPKKKRCLFSFAIGGIYNNKWAIKYKWNSDNHGFFISYALAFDGLDFGSDLYGSPASHLDTYPFISDADIAFHTTIQSANEGASWVEGDPLHITTTIWYWCEKTYDTVTASEGALAEGRLLSTQLLQKREDLYQPHRTSSFQTNDLKYNSGGSSASSTTAFSIGLYIYNHQSKMDDIGTRIAATLSAQMRSQNPSDNANASYIDGTAVIEETYYHVRGQWIILPLVVTFLFTASLCATILTTKELPLYKGSTLALVKKQIDGFAEDYKEAEVSEKEDKKETAEFLDDSAKIVSVNLKRDKITQKWALRKYKGSEV